MRFWDASGILPLLVPEACTEDASALMRSDHDFAIWWATPVECVSALTRLVRDHKFDEAALDKALLRLDALVERGSVIEPSEAVREQARRLLRVHPLRAADALQLAAAVAMRGPGAHRAHIVTYDQRLATAARREGFTVN
jgi:predicted nucleic acid-binding protein